LTLQIPKSFACEAETKNDSPDEAPFTMRNRTIIVIVGIAFLSIAIAAGVIWQWSRNLLVVENASGKVATSVVVTVCGETYYLANIAPGNSKTITFKVDNDSGFLVDVIFEDRTTLSTSFGYVTGGAGANHNRAAVRIGTDNIDGKQIYRFVI
jgi:hypothetical protein